MAIGRSRHMQNEEGMRVVLADDITRRVFERLALMRASSTTRLVGDLKLGYDAVRSALATLEKANLIQREDATSSGSPGIDYFILTEDGAWIAQTLPGSNRPLVIKPTGKKY